MCHIPAPEFKRNQQFSDTLLAAEQYDNSLQWYLTEGKQKHTRNWIITLYGNAGLSALSAGSTIYVRGHGGAGDHELDATGDGQGTISYETVCDRMIEDGLQRSFMGTIKFSNCSSGVPTLGRQCFAAKASQYFRFKKGYLLISFVGYMGPIDGKYNVQGADPNDDRHMHLHVTAFGREIKSKWMQFRF
ncbi:MAG: hypothetical protein ACRD3T_07990 [Terriglobia bacterium]